MIFSFRLEINSFLVHTSLIIFKNGAAILVACIHLCAPSMGANPIVRKLAYESNKSTRERQLRKRKQTGESATGIVPSKPWREGPNRTGVTRSLTRKRRPGSRMGESPSTRLCGLAPHSLLGSTILPMNKRLPVWLSRIMKRNG